jgi:hypothetical protein
LDKLGAMKGQTWIWIIIAGLIVLVLKPDILSGIGGGTGTVDDTVAAVCGDSVCSVGEIYTCPGDCGQACLNVEDTTLTFGPSKGYDFHNTSLTSEWHRVFINGEDQGLKKDSTTMTVSPGDKIDVYYGANSSLYYAAKHSFTVPCKGAVQTGTLPDSEAERLYWLVKVGSSAPTITVLDSTGQVINATTNDAGNNESGVGNGDERWLTVVYNGRKGRAISPYGKIRAVCQANQTTIEDVMFSESDGWTKTGSKPNNLTSQTGQNYFVYEHDGLIDAGQTRWSLGVKMDDTADLTIANENWYVNCTLYDSNWYLSQDGKMLMDVEDDQDRSLGIANPYGIAAGTNDGRELSFGFPVDNN